MDWVQLWWISVGDRDDPLPALPLALSSALSLALDSPLALDSLLAQGQALSWGLGAPLLPHRSGGHQVHWRGGREIERQLDDII